MNLILRYICVKPMPLKTIKHLSAYKKIAELTSGDTIELKTMEVRSSYILYLIMFVSLFHQLSHCQQANLNDTCSTTPSTSNVSQGFVNANQSSQGSNCDHDDEDSTSFPLDLAAALGMFLSSPFLSSLFLFQRFRIPKFDMTRLCFVSYMFNFRRWWCWIWTTMPVPCKLQVASSPKEKEN